MLTLLSCLQGGDIQQQLERSRPGNMHLQNTIRPCASPALFTHKTPCIYMQGSLQRSGAVSRAVGEVFLADHNLQLGPHFISLQIHSNVNVHIKTPLKDTEALSHIPLQTVAGVDFD